MFNLLLFAWVPISNGFVAMKIVGKYTFLPIILIIQSESDPIFEAPPRRQLNSIFGDRILRLVSLMLDVGLS